MEENNKIEFEINDVQGTAPDTSAEAPQAEAKETPKAEAAEKEKKTGKKRRVKPSDIFAGRVLASNKVVQQLPLALMVLLYSFLLISSRYSIENLTLENKQLQHEIDELRVRQIQNRCDYMNATMLTEISEKLSDKGIKAGTTPSLKITIKEK